MDFFSEVTELCRKHELDLGVDILGHPLVRAASEMGLTPFISPTTSDMSLMHGIPSLKIGPGDSARSHSADEFILIDEIEQAISLYPKLIRKCSNETLGQGF